MRTAVVASLISLALVLVGALSARPPTASAAPPENPWLGQRVMDMAHSGGEDEAPMNTLYAFERAAGLGADMLETDVQLTGDGDLAVIHDATVDDSTDRTGRVDAYTMDQLRAMDAAYWFVPGRSTVHDDPAAEYPLRGARTAEVEVPGHTPSDFGVPSLSDVLAAFPDMPVNIEIKGSGTEESYLACARELAAQLNDSGRTDVIVGSFSDEALALFHELAPQVPMSAGQEAMTAYFLSGTPLPEGVVALQMPITFSGLRVVTRDFVDRAHADGYAVHAWFSGSAPDDAATYAEVLDTCVDGVMPAKPSVLEEVMAEKGIERPTPGGTPPRPECAGEPEPTAPEPTTSEPSGPEPTTSEPTTSEPTVADPSAPEPSGSETEPTSDAPSTPEPTTSGPTDGEATTTGPDASASSSRTAPTKGEEAPPSSTEPERPAVVQTDGW